MPHIFMQLLQYGQHNFISLFFYTMTTKKISYKNDPTAWRVKKALQNKIQNPNDLNDNYNKAIIDLNELNLNFYHEKGLIVFTVWASAKAKEDGSIPLGTIGANIERTEKLRKDGSILCFAFDDIFGKSEEEIITKLKNSTLRVTPEKTLTFENGVIVEGVEGKNKESESMTEEEEEEMKSKVEKKEEETTKEKTPAESK